MVIRGKRGFPREMADIPTERAGTGGTAATMERAAARIRAAEESGFPD